MDILFIYGVAGLLITFGLCIYYGNRRNEWPESLSELTLLECLLLLCCVPEIILFSLTKIKPFKARNKVR